MRKQRPVLALLLVAAIIAATISPAVPVIFNEEAYAAGMDYAYIIISAGPDGIYGSADDIYTTNAKQVSKLNNPAQIAQFILNVNKFKIGKHFYYAASPAKPSAFEYNAKDGKGVAGSAVSGGLKLSTNLAQPPVGEPAIITLEVKDENGNPIANVPVHFETTLGTLNPQDTVTDGDGIAQTILTSTQPGTAVVTATVNGQTISYTIYFGEGNGSQQPPQLSQPASITFSNVPQTATTGSNVAITIVVKDDYGQPISGVPVHFETTLGTISPQDATTDQNGAAEAVLSSSQAGVAIITVAADDLTVQQEVTFYAAGPQPLRQPASDEIPIRTPEELAKIGVDPSYPLNGKYILMANLDLSGYSNWTPIGNSSNRFTGTFDGNGLVIKNLTISRPTTNYQGLFGCTDSGAKLTNIGLENVNVTGYNFTGGLVGCINRGTITNSYSTGSVTGNYYTGGLVGENLGTITSSYSTGSVTGNYYTGGLVGENPGTITNSYSTGSVKGNNDDTGGLVGYNRGTITNSYSTGSVTGGNYFTGGLAGENFGTITSSYWDTETSGQNSSAGGTGKTTAQMKQQATFSGWNFTTVWAIDEGVSYPYLRSNEQIPHPGTN